MQVSKNGKEYTVAEGHDWFWPGFADGSWEPSTFKIFDQFLDKNESMLDIGAWIGPTALYAADKAKKIFAFEPDPIAFFRLVQNIELNKVKNIIPYPVAVADRWKEIPFGPRTQFGDSMSSELWAKGDSEVAAVSLTALVMDIMPGFIKIDIEGGEKHIFHGSELVLEQLKPTIHLSLHTPWHKENLESFKSHITQGLSMYPYIYDENLQLVKLDDMFNTVAFNSVVASFKKI